MISLDERVKRPQKRYRSISCPDDGSNGRRPDHQPEKLLPECPGGVFEYGSGRVFRINAHAGEDNAQRGEKEQISDRGGNEDACGCALVDFLQRTFAPQARVEQAVRAGERYVPAHGPAYEREGGDGVEFFGEKGVFQGTFQWRVRGECDIENEGYHHKTEDFGETVHRFPGFFEKENGDSNARADDGAGFDGNARHSFDAQARAGYIADVECESACYDEECEEVAEAGEQFIGQVLGAFAGNGDDLPDIELDGEVDQDGYQNNKTETRCQFFGEYSRLRQEAGTYRGGGHQECCA